MSWMLTSADERTVYVTSTDAQTMLEALLRNGVKLEDTDRKRLHLIEVKDRPKAGA